MSKELKEARLTVTSRRLSRVNPGEPSATPTSPRVADVEGYPEVAANFRETAEARLGTRTATSDYLSGWVTRPPTCRSVTTRPPTEVGRFAGETHEYTDMSPGDGQAGAGPRASRIADWFETLSKAEKSHAAASRDAPDDQLIARMTGCVVQRSLAAPPHSPWWCNARPERTSQSRTCPRKGLSRSERSSLLAAGDAGTRMVTRTLEICPWLPPLFQVLRLIPVLGSASSMSAITGMSTA